MINSHTEYLELIECGDSESQFRLRNEPAADAVWLKLIEEYPEHLGAVAFNRTLPATILSILAKDQDWRIRASIAMRRALQLELFDLLSHDEHETVRAQIAWNKKTPRDILLRLANDPEQMVFEVARKRLEDDGKRTPKKGSSDNPEFLS